MLSRFVNFGEFELDREGFQLRREGSAVRIESLPLRLLTLLIARRGEVVNRREIEEELWGPGVFVDVEQGINTAIRKIRLTLREHPERPRYLQTIVGKGYRFLATDVTESDHPSSDDRKDGRGKPTVTLEELGQAILAAAGLQDPPPDLPPDEPERP